MHIDFELGDALRREGMGDGLSFPSVFRTISCVEKTPCNGDEDIVVISAEQSAQLYR